MDRQTIAIQAVQKRNQLAGKTQRQQEKKKTHRQKEKRRNID